jgi:hypothetical protein
MLGGYAALADVAVTGLQPKKGTFNGTITDQRYTFVPYYTALVDAYGPGTGPSFKFANDNWLFNFTFRFPYQDCGLPNPARFWVGSWEARIKIAFFDPRIPTMQFWSPPNNNPYAVGYLNKSSLPSQQLSWAQLYTSDQLTVGNPLGTWLTSQIQPGQKLVYYEILFCVKGMLFQEVGTSGTYCVNDPTAYNGEYKIIIWFDQSLQPNQFTPQAIETYTHNVNCGG